MIIWFLVQVITSHIDQLHETNIGAIYNDLADSTV